MNIVYNLNKSDDDINSLVKQNKNLVYYVLSKLGCLYEPDYESAGFEGLWHAAATFDVFSSTAFSTYAYTCIRNAINDARRKTARRNAAEVVIDFTLTDFEMPMYDCALDAESSWAVEKIMECTRYYIDNIARGVNTQNIIRAWYASNFTRTVTELSKICNTSCANVSRAQATFRAYLQTKLRG